MNLAYLPIDIPMPILNETKLLEWFENHKLLDTDYWEYQQGRHTWALVSTCKMTTDWRRFDSTMWENRRVESENQGVLFHPGFQDEFPEIANCIKQLPFKQLTVSGMLYQMNEISTHKDTADPHNPTEPRRYTIYLTNPEYNTFYVSKTETSEKVLVKVDPNYSCFVFNNTNVWHGALKNNRPKIILTTAGILDNEKHEELLARSLEKFKDKAIYL